MFYIIHDLPMVFDHLFPLGNIQSIYPQKEWIIPDLAHTYQLYEWPFWFYKQIH